ncbi:hypothetical protein PPERSA_06494 [Pseudocohnilembus persalinus]|uniref:Uncharacterized protein n=1 Tax=Pseudocohnilembus persalinus TaxID=266149 RepID=A0A0V0QRN6_PSEPJ|nr:hypothetical protein PPERSA_06494 [Pseudocohnilembus persalinus]|eukprot:KRX04860.1 hypothetical protein PPERSA_06494 [Pseudocohnilembus persalinus]
MTLPTQDQKLNRLTSIRQALENDETRARKQAQYESYREPYNDHTYNQQNDTQSQYSNQIIPNNLDTYQKLDKLKKDYLFSGGKDQTFLNNISNLEDLHRESNKKFEAKQPIYGQQPNSTTLNITYDTNRSQNQILNQSQFLDTNVSYPNQSQLKYPVMNGYPTDIQNKLNQLELENRQLKLHSSSLDTNLDILGPVRNMNEAQIIKYLWAQENQLISSLQGLNPLSTDHYVKDQQLAKVRELRLALELMHSTGNDTQNQPQQQFIQPVQQQPQVIVIKSGNDYDYPPNYYPYPQQQPPIYQQPPEPVKQPNKTTAIQTEDKKPETPEKPKRPQNDFFSSDSDTDGQGLLVRVMGIVNHRGNSEIKCRNCIVDFKKVVNDLDGGPCAQLINLQGQQKGGNLLTTHRKIYNFDYNRMLKKMTPQELQNVKWYISFYDENTGEQYGWLTANVFRFENGRWVVNSGRFAQNMLQPPAQKPPFDGPKIKMPVYCDYVIMRYDENEKNLPLIDLVEQQEQPEFDDPSKTLKIEIQNIVGNFPKKQNYLYYDSLMNQDEPLIDRDGISCEKNGPLVVMNQKNGFIQYNHINAFRVSDGLLRKQIPKNQRQNCQVMVEITDINGNSLGIVPIPLFKPDNYTVNRGTHKIQMLNIDARGQQQQTGSVAQVRIELDGQDAEEVDILDKEYDLDKGLLLNIGQMRNFKENYQITFQIKIINGSQILIDSDGHQAYFENEDFYGRDERRKNLVDIQEGTEMPVNWKKVRDDCKRKQKYWKNIGVLIKFLTNQNGKCFAWLMHPLFTADGQLNRGKFQGVKLWKPPAIEQMPIQRNIQETELILDYEIDQCRLDDDFVGAVHNSDSEDSLLAESDTDYAAVFVNNIQDSGKSINYNSLQAKVAMVENGNFMKGGNGQLAVVAGQPQKVLGQQIYFNEYFGIDVNIGQLRERKPQPAEKYFILIQFSDQRGQLIYWGFLNLFTKNYNLKSGQQTIDLYYGPIQKPPLNKSNLKKTNAKCSLSLRFDNQNDDDDEDDYYDDEYY